MKILTYTITIQKKVPKRYIKYIADNLSKQNREEAAILYPDWDIYDLLHTYCNSVDIAFIILDDEGNPYGLGGISDTNSIFFVVRENLDRRMNIKLLRVMKKRMKYFLRYRPLIWGKVWDKAKQTMRWLPYMGFTIYPSCDSRTGRAGKDNFLYFEMRNDYFERKRSKELECAGELCK